MYRHLNDQPRPIELRRDGGVALILVMLSMLILSVLAATIVFTARAETFASQNYKLDTQADYLAKAGIQRAINWLRSNHYQPLRPCAPQYNPTYCTNPDPSTIYNLTSTGAPYYLYTSHTSPVQCIATSPTCASTNSPVQLMGYNGTSNYPTINNTQIPAALVSNAFTTDLNDSTLTNNRVTGDASNSGYFTVDATLLSYQTVNVTPPPSPVPSYCVQTTVVVCPVETWQITSKAYWTGTPGSTFQASTAEETAIVQPIYWPTFGNALYGYCSVSMTGSAGTCTDAFNSALGPYAGGNGSVASGLCDQTSSNNVISTGAGVGANGSVTLGSNVTVGGNVTIGSSPSSGCPTPYGYSGSTSSVLGEVINGPHITPPTVPTFPAGFPGTAKSFLNSGDYPATVPSTIAAWTPAAPWPFVPPSGAPPLATTTVNCMTGLTCNGTANNPYLIGTIKMTSSVTLSLVGGPNALNPVYYDIACIAQTGGNINISGYVVLNVQGSSSCSGSTGMDLEGNGISNGMACTAPCTNIPPEALQINYAGTNNDGTLSGEKVKIGGNGAIAAVITAPNSNVTLGGGGANGYMVGSIQANNVSVSGGYPIHYDVQLGRVGGSLGTMVTTAYGRKKM
jgi:hypothetical protein